MKALVLKEYGSIDQLEIRDIAKPVPRRNQVLIKVHAASVNDWDWANVQGGFNRIFMGMTKPKRVLGCDVAGYVDAVGAGVRKFKPGDRVYGDLCRDGFGAFAEYACVKEASLELMSPQMSIEQAAAIPQGAVLMLQALQGLRPLQSGQEILFNGAGGAVGTMGIQVAKLHEVEVTGVDSGPKLELLRSLGFDHVVDYTREDFTNRGFSYDLIVDVKTNRHPRDYLRALKPNGLYATVGGTGLLKMFMLGRWIGRSEGKSLRVVGLKPNRGLSHVNELFEAGKFTPVIDRVYKFTTEDLRSAFRYYAAANQRGKLVISIA